MNRPLDLLPLSCVPSPRVPQDASFEQQFDFRTDGPPKPRCSVCSKRFEDWAAPDEDWRKIPQMYWPCQLCKRDYRKLLRKAGHDPDSVTISDEPWRQRVALWESTRSMPADHVHVLMKKGGGNDDLREAKVVRQLDPIVHLVHVFKKNVAKRSRSKGTPYLACWGKIHYQRDTGRPIMIALRRLPDPEEVCQPKSLTGAKNRQDIEQMARALWEVSLAGTGAGTGA